MTVIKGSRSWRYDLRKRKFVDRKPPARDVPDGVTDHIEENIDEIVAAWDAMYPDNPVEAKEEE